MLTVVICVNPLESICSDLEYPPHSPYEKNLNNLLNILSTKIPPYGFGLSILGNGVDQINGLGLCRGDVSSKDCSACVSEASKKILDVCTGSKAGIIWYDHCFLRYSHEYFFGKIDYQEEFFTYNPVFASNTKLLEDKMKELLNGLSVQASQKRTFFATGELVYDDSSHKLYGMAQCTIDLSTSDCKTSLDAAIKKLSSCCSGRIGARVKGGSYSVRYEMYPFLNNA
ncbi:hypothetical protein JCGZ_22906 [Jatropha curcas]|uniref:Gnk2-homologous domain-containing protein n=2 Tax=Jatropha curcas TaxID=180498 RepID=A0A067JPH9_JATCU|nr:hypothetical protein JCGZ_22906 [Jatropha curcas]